MAGSADVCLGIIVAIAIVLISYTAWRKWRTSKIPKITYTTPASQDLVAASGVLTDVLDGILELGKQFDDPTPSNEDVNTIVAEEADMVIVDSVTEKRDKYPPEIRMSIMTVMAPATRIAENLKTSRPTYASIHAVYKGLSGADEMYQRVADVYIAKGSSIRCAPLVNVGKQLHVLIRAIHELGSALNLE